MNKKNFSNAKLRGMQKNDYFSNLNPKANNIQFILIIRTQNIMI